MYTYCTCTACMCISSSVYYCASILKANQTVVLTRQIWFKPEQTKGMLNMAILIRVRGRPLRMHACMRVCILKLKY